MAESKSKTNIREILEYSDRGARILERMHNFAKANRFCNVDVLLKDKNFSTNTLLLAASSEYFECLFVDASKDNSVKMKDLSDKVSPVVMERLVNFFYTSKLEIDEDNVDDMLSAASVLLLFEIFEDCLKFLEKHLRPDNCLRNLKLGKKYSNDNLQKKAFLYAVENFTDVRHQEDFLKLDIEDIYELLKSEDLNVTSEKIAFEGLTAWILHDKPNRFQYLTKLLNLIKLPLLPPRYLFDVVSPFVNNGSDCNKPLDEALQWHILPDRRSKLHSNRTKPRKSTQVILLVGSWVLNNSMKVNVYDSSRDSWSHYMDLNINKQRFGSALVDNKLLIFGGDIGKEPFNTVDLIDLKTKSTTSLSPMNNGRSAPVVVELDNFVYAIGGFNVVTGQPLNFVEKWNPSTRLWMTLEPLTTARMGSSAVSANGKIFVIGGGNTSVPYSSVECYDPTSNTWELGVPMNEKRKWNSAVNIGDFIYVFGGDDFVHNVNGARLQSVERFDLKLKKWTKMADLVQGGDNISVCPIQNKVLCVGGYSTTFHRTVQLYDTETNTYRLLAPTIDDRSFSNLISVSRDVLEL